MASPLHLLLAVLVLCAVCQASGSGGRLRRVEDKVDRVIDILEDLHPTDCEGDNLVTMDNGYFLAFRIQPGSHQSTFNAYYDTDKVGDGDDPLMRAVMTCGCQISWNASCSSLCHFRSRILDKWSYLPIERVRVGVYKDGQEKRFIEFNGVGSTVTNWFHSSRIVSSSYTDISSASFNYFSIAGHARLERRFFINRNYFGCPNDKGWLVVLDKANRPCGWERRATAVPAIMYSKGNEATNWNTDANVGIADFLAISVLINIDRTCNA